RVLQRDTRVDWVRLQTAIMTGDLDAAVREAERPVALRTEPEHLQRSGQQARLLEDLVAAHRDDLLKPFAVYLLEDALVDGHVGGAVAEKAMRALAERDPAQATRLAVRFDAAGRNIASAASLNRAVIASAGWSILGEAARVRALVEIWAPTVAREVNGC